LGAKKWDLIGAEKPESITTSFEDVDKQDQNY
jgi:hypothetical protein